jgi:hypothetical protein
VRSNGGTTGNFCRVILLIGTLGINGLMLHLVKWWGRILRLRTEWRRVVGAGHHVRGRWAFEVVDGLILRLLRRKATLEGLLTAWTIRVVPVGIRVSFMGRVALERRRIIEVIDGVSGSMTRVLLRPPMLHHHLSVSRP